VVGKVVGRMKHRNIRARASWTQKSVPDVAVAESHFVIGTRSTHEKLALGDSVPQLRFKTLSPESNHRHESEERSS